MKVIAVMAGLTLFVVALGTALYRYVGADGTGAAVAPVEGAPDALLSRRLAIAVGALRDAEGTRRQIEVQRYALVAVDALAGPEGRHGRDGAPSGGILPADADSSEREPGLALRAYDAAPADGPLRAAIDGRLTGGVDAWRMPRARYDAIDRATAAFDADAGAVDALPGALDRALAWALLASRAEDVNDGHARAARAANAAREALDAVRTARAAR